MRLRRTLLTAVGMGLLFAWMESVFIQHALMERLHEAGYSGWSPVHLFLGVHGLTYLLQALIPGRSGDERNIGVLGVCSMLSLPLFLFLSTRLSGSYSSMAILSGLIFSAAGAALMLGMWGMSLTSLIPDDVAVVFGLAPLAALLLLVASASASLFNSLFLLIVVPLLSMILLFYSAEESIEGQFEAAAVPLPFWRLSVFLFCLYAANGFLLELRPALFHPTAAAAAGHDALLSVASTLAAAAAFRFYPRAELKTFYKGAFPFIATALFLMAFTPVYTPPRLLLETGLAFLDLYAWLLLIYFASRAGRRRKAVVHGGLFLIVLAEGAVHLAVLPREAGYLALLVPGVCLLLLMLVLWDGREVPLQAGQTGEGPAPATVVEGADDDRGEELFLRAKLMEFNLTRQETEIALLLLKGQKDRSICSMLFITQNTLKYHLRNIYRKTGTANRLDLRENLG